jgi:hypothetical protein
VKRRIVNLIASLIEDAMAIGEARTYAAADRYWEQTKQARHEQHRRA